MLPVPLLFKADITGIAGVSSLKWEIIYNDDLLGDLILFDQTTTYAADYLFTFTAPAAYKVKVTIVDRSVTPITYMNILDVTIDENAMISPLPSTGAYPLTVAFKPLYISQIDALRDYIHWDFKNIGSIDSTDFYPSYTYVNVGDYICKMDVRWKFQDKYNAELFVYTSISKYATVTVTSPGLLLSISVDPQQGRKPLVSLVTGVSNNPVAVWHWYINKVEQVPVSQQIQVTFEQSGTYSLKLEATDVYGSGPKTVYASVYVSRALSVEDVSLSIYDPNRFMNFIGSADVLPSKTGIGVKAGIIPNFQNSGFSHDGGPGVIFS